jgi:aminopeptidase
MLLCLPIKTAGTTFQRPSISNLFANMSTKAYIVPIDPNAPSSQSTVPNLDPAKLWSTVPASKKVPKAGTTRLFYDVPSGGSNITAIVSLGDAYGSQKGDGKREVVRKTVGSAVTDLKAHVDDEITVSVDASADPQAAGNVACVFSNFIHSNFCIKAVAAHLALYKFTLKTDPPSDFKPDLNKPIPEQLKFEPLTTSKEWDAGVIAARAQNLARTVRLSLTTAASWILKRSRS